MPPAIATAAPATKLYWAESTNGQILRGNADGSGLPTILVTGQDNPRGLVIHRGQERMYWIERDAGRIRSANLDGSGITTILSGLTSPDRMALDEQNGHLYWTVNGIAGRIRRANLNGTGEMTIISGLDAPVGIALDIGRNTIYWTEFDSDSIWRATLQGGNVQKLVQQPTGTNPLELALDLDDYRMYWVTGPAGDIYSATMDGGNVTLWGDFENTRTLAVDPDGDKLYWASHDTNRIRRASLNGTGIETLFSATDGVEKPVGLVPYTESTVPCYSLSTSVSPGASGTVTASPSPNCTDGKYSSGTTVILTAVANSGFSFTNWSGALSGVTNPQSVVMNGNRSVTANFEHDCFSLNVASSPSDGGSVVASPSSNCTGGNYLSGTTVTLTALANSDYRFSNWSGALSGATNPQSLVMNGNRSVTANFAEEPLCRTLKITIDPSMSGNVAVSPPPNCANNGYANNTELTLSAMPATGYGFSSWSGDLSGSNSPSTLLMDGDKSVTASFLPLATCYQLSRTMSGNGIQPIATPSSSTGCSSGWYKSGQMIDLTASPAQGWRVAGWSGTNNDGSTQLSNTVIMPPRNHLVSVRYTEIQDNTNTTLLPAILTPFCFTGPRESEPNNSIIEANGPLCGPGLIRGLPNDSQDWFMFVMPTRGTISTELTGHRGDKTQLSLYHDLELVVGDSDETDGLVLSVGNQPPGLYRVFIFSATPNVTTTERYTLSIEYP